MQNPWDRFTSVLMQPPEVLFVILALNLLDQYQILQFAIGVVLFPLLYTREETTPLIGLCWVLLFLSVLISAKNRILNWLDEPNHIQLVIYHLDQLPVKLLASSSKGSTATRVISSSVLTFLQDTSCQ